MTCYALLMLLPISLGSHLIVGSRPAISMSTARVAEVVEESERTAWTEPQEASAISITIEPAPLPPVAEVESPVVFPGYLLPDDQVEEPTHAGS